MTDLTTYTNEKGEEVIISTMDNSRLIHAIAKYSRKIGANEVNGTETGIDDEIVKALKAEAFKRLAEKSE